MCRTGDGNNQEPQKERDRHKIPRDSHQTTRDQVKQSPPQSTQELSQAVMEMMKLQSAPKPNLDAFSGDPLEYFYFKATFREVVEVAVPDQRGRLTRLINFTSGEAKDLIKHLVHASPLDCYDKAVKLLDKEFGNPHLISCSYIKEIRQWECVKQHDSAGYKKLYRFLLKCQAYKEGNRLNELDSIDMLRTIICKLHTTHQERWNRKAVNIRQKEGREANFSDLLEFMETQATLMCDPAFSRDALAEASKTIKSNSTKMGGNNNDNNKSNIKDNDSNNKNNDKNSDNNSTDKNSDSDNKNNKAAPSCPLCKSQHDIEQCATYLAQGIDDRHKTVFQYKLCFSCLGYVGQDHVSKSCDKKRKCMVCGKEHPTTLHGGRSISGNNTTIESNTVSVCVVPVQLWHTDDEGVESERVTVYALLDECSQGTFITDDALESLNIKNEEIRNKRPTAIRVTTINGSKQGRSTAIKGLQVDGIPSHTSMYGSYKMGLKITYSREFLAVDKDEIATIAKISAWDHLRAIADKIPEYDPSIPVGLMIGGDNIKAIEPLEIVQSNDDGPYAKRTRMGWCIVGPIDKGSVSRDIHSNRTGITEVIQGQDITTGKPMSHTFATASSVQDMYVTNMLKEMFIMDFTEPASEKEGMSAEDRKFIQIMDDNVSKKNCQYELPLPFRNADVHLPNNRVQALRRLQSLKRKLLADEKYCTAYNKFMKNLVTCAYARKAENSNDVPGKIWYAPHFGVLNPKKGKLRIVHDFSVTFKGRCLNEELIQGPNLANSMLGVILRFRREDVAYMADIEAMFFQVLVPEDQRSFLRYIYWPNGDLEAEPEDYEMCVHPFWASLFGKLCQLRSETNSPR